MVDTVIEYASKYDEQVKDLLVELQEHIVFLDKEKYNIISENFREKYFAKTIEEIHNNNGKMLLARENNNIVGVIVGIINNDECEEYNFIAPKRGRITELIVSNKCRSKGIGTRLLRSMENYLHGIGCKDILLSAFAYNDSAIKFYENNGYHMRMLDMTKGM